MKRIILLSFAFIAINFSFSQSTPKETVETYFKGYKNGDPEILKTVFHPTFQLSWISPWHKGNDAFKKVNREGMFDFFDENWKNLKIISSIKELQTDGNVAYCKAIVVLEGIVTWTDYISMLKINGKWWIVSKVSDGKLANN